MEEKQITIQVPTDYKPTFANSVKVHVTDEEVALEFVYMRHDEARGVLTHEVVLTPQHAMRFQKALDETLKKHFTRHLQG